MAGLSSEQQAFFREQGYLVAKNVIPTVYVHELQREIASVIDRDAQALAATGEIRDLRPELDVLHRATALFKQSPKILRSVDGGGHVGPAMFNLLTCPNLLDAVASLVGPEIIASAVYRIRPKLPFRAAGDVPWHQDSGYFDPSGDPHLILTCWVPLMNATVQAGCMEVLPGSHRAGIRRHFWARNPAPPLTVHPDHLPDTAPVPVPADIGDVVMMTNFTCHRSTPNTSGLIRWAADLRFNAPEAGNYYPYEAEFVARSPSHPERVVTDWRAFAHLRTEHRAIGGVNRSWLHESRETFIKPPR